MVRDSARVEIVESAALSSSEANGSSPFVIDSVPTVLIGVEGGEEPYQLYEVSDAYRLDDGRIVIANAGSHQLRVFDAKGRFLKSVGRIGEGPGEFGSGSIHLHAAGDSLLATDDGGFRAHIYGSDLGFRETRRFVFAEGVARPFLRGVFDDGSWLAFANEGGGSLRGPPGTVIGLHHSLLHYDEAGRLLDTLGSFSGRKRYVNRVGEVTHYPYLPFTADPLEAVIGDELVVLVADKAELEYRDYSGRVRRIVRWPRERVLSATLWPAYRDTALAGLADGSERDRRLYGPFYEKELPLPEFAPLYVSMRVDPDRRIWLERFRMPGVRSSRTWDVIDSSGAWLGVVHTPAGLSVYRVGADYLLGRSLDSLGVERVQLHALRRVQSP